MTAPRPIPMIIRRIECGLPITDEEGKLLEQHIEETRRWFAKLKWKAAILVAAVLVLIAAHLTALKLLE